MTPTSEDRPEPFALRVAAQWAGADEVDSGDDGALIYRRRASLTGELAWTRDGADVRFSDIGIDA